MLDSALLERVTRTLALMLRHQPELFDLELDAHGFGEVEEVLRALEERLGVHIEVAELAESLQGGDRVRYEIDGARIRALYGHSIPIEAGAASKPPERLYVGLARADAERALRQGLRGGRRRFLHLSKTPEEAAEAARRCGRLWTVLAVRAMDGWEDGINFYDRNVLWLTEELPGALLVEETYGDDGSDPRPHGAEARGSRHERRHERGGRHGGDRHGGDRQGGDRHARGAAGQHGHSQHAHGQHGRGSERHAAPRGAERAPDAHTDDLDPVDTHASSSADSDGYTEPSNGDSYAESAFDAAHAAEGDANDESGAPRYDDAIDSAHADAPRADTRESSGGSAPTEGGRRRGRRGRGGRGRGDDERGGESRSYESRGEQRHADPARGDGRASDARHGDARAHESRHSGARHAESRHAESRHGESRHGESRQGESRHAEPRRGDGARGEQHAPHAHRGEGRGDARHEGRHEDRREPRHEGRRESRPERRDGAEHAAQEPRRPREPAAQAPARVTPPPPAQSGDFGLGIFEVPASAPRSAGANTRSEPPARAEPAREAREQSAPGGDGSGFGAGL